MGSRFKNCRTWLIRKLFWPFYELIGLRVRGVHYGYEKAGLTVTDEAIPWNAEAVLVDAEVWFPPGRVKRKCDFQLGIPGRPPLIPVMMYPAEADGAFHIVFRLPPLRAATVATLCSRDKALARVPLPFVSAATFVESLRLQLPTLVACLGKHHVECRAFVASQCRNMLANGLLTSPTSLLPLADFDLFVECEDPATGPVQRFAVSLTSAQLLGRQALLSVLALKWPRMPGTRTVRWVLRDQVLATVHAHCIPQAALTPSLYLIEGRFLHRQSDGTSTIIDHLPLRDDSGHVCPCFLVSSRERGLAALCPLEVHVQFSDPARPPLVWRDEMLVTDGPLLCFPGILSVEEFQEVRAFELYSDAHLFGVLPVGSTPMATFTPEGAFRRFDDYDWSPITEKELVLRLQSLMEVSWEENGCNVGPVHSRT